jgi:hypothetical protein
MRCDMRTSIGPILTRKYGPLGNGTSVTRQGRRLAALSGNDGAHGAAEAHNAFRRCVGREMKMGTIAWCVPHLLLSWCDLRLDKRIGISKLLDGGLGTLSRPSLVKLKRTQARIA